MNSSTRQVPERFDNCLQTLRCGQRNEQVYLMLLTAFKHNNGGHSCEQNPFYGAINTGAT